MKIKLIILTVVVLLTACSKEIPSHRLVFNGEIAFEAGSNKPFTGVANEYKNSYLQSLSHFKNGVLTKEENFYKNGQLKKLVIIDAAGIAKTTLFTESGKDVTNERQKTYWENGVTQSTYQYSNGLKDGLWEKFDPTGVSVERNHWNNGILLEPIRYEKFKVRNDIIYLADSELPFSGMIQYTTKFEDYKDKVNTVKINHQVQDGQLLGIIEVYVNKLLFVYSTVSGVIKPLDITNIENSTWDFTVPTEGERALSGIMKDFDFKGRKQSVCEVETFNSKSRWSCQYFYDNGQIQQIENYLYPLINNTYTNQGYFDGEQKEYYPSGEIYRIKYYKADQKVGDWKVYSMDGIDISNGQQKAEEIDWSGYFSSGRKHGIWTNGGSYKTYNNGTLDGEAHLSADSKYSDEKGIYVDGKREGKWETNSGGFKNYKNGRLDGKYLQIWPHDGCIWNSGVYSEGEKNGEWIEWSVDAPKVNGCRTKTVVYEMGIEKKGKQ